MTPREAAWAALFEPATDGATLARIAEEHPEFAEAIAQHPNCYDGLREWLAANAAPDADAARAPAHAGAEPFAREEAVTDAAAAPVANKRRSRKALLIGAVISAVVIVLGGGGVWAMMALMGGGGTSPGVASTPGGGVPSSGRTLAGPPVYIGDELAWFLLDEDQVREFFPDAGEITDGDLLVENGESEGAHTDPEVCIDWVIRSLQPVVGARTESWASGSTGTQDGAMVIYQFPTADVANDFYRVYSDSVDACASFQMLSGEGTASGTPRTLNVAARSDAAVVVDDVVRGSSSSDVDKTTRLVALEGNVVVMIDAPRGHVDIVDPEGLLAAVTARMADARARLTEEIGLR